MRDNVEEEPTIELEIVQNGTDMAEDEVKAAEDIPQEILDGTEELYIKESTKSREKMEFEPATGQLIDIQADDSETSEIHSVKDTDDGFVVLNDSESKDEVGMCHDNFHCLIYCHHRRESYIKMLYHNHKLLKSKCKLVLGVD